MPARVRRRVAEADVHGSKGEMSFDVVEWLEGERQEHERRMQELGCSRKTTEEPRGRVPKKAKRVKSK
jgi:hypothetical protein